MYFPFITRDKKGELFWDESNLTHRGRISIGDFCVRGNVYEGCSEDSMYLFFSFLSFLDTLFLYMRSCDHLYTYIVLIFSSILLMYVFLSPTLSCVVSFLSLYTCFLLFVCNLLFLFHIKMSWWVLFKVFQKYRLSKSTCHKLSSCKVFQEFVLW